MDKQYKLTPFQINKLATAVHAWNKSVGWWDEPNPCMLTKMQLCSTEVAEATEGVRKNLMDDHLPHRFMEEVELADTFIRAVDVGAYCDIVYESTDIVDTMAKEFELNKDSPAALHFFITCAVVSFGCSSFLKSEDSKPDPYMYSVLLDTIMFVAFLRGFDLAGAIDEKLVYNQNRADHKRENRAKDHGKKF